jgi:hypothetical protein
MPLIQPKGNDPVLPPSAPDRLSAFYRNKGNRHMSATDSRGGDLASLESDIAALKRDVASLIGHLKAGVTGGAQSAAEQIGDESARLYGIAMADCTGAAKAVATRVGEQPLMCLAIALGLGFAGGRLLAR